MNYHTLTPPPDITAKCVCGEILQSVTIPDTEDSLTGLVSPCGCEVGPEELEEIVINAGSA